MVKVTDKNYYMDGYEVENLKEIPKFLKKSWDVVSIVSGHGKVRIGKSTKAIQQAYYIAWLLAGGEKKPLNVPVPFSNDNVVFDPGSLMKKAEQLPSMVNPNPKLPGMCKNHSVIVYDEGRAGLDTKRAMESINKGMIDFFQECGQFGHVIIIVLPNFFRLTEDMAISRSLFLTDVYTDKKYRRGYFGFYNEPQKELLYYIGRKKYGTVSKYLSINPFFRGRFTKFFPINREMYEKQKKLSYRKSRITRFSKKFIKQRNACFYVMNRELKMIEEDISSRVSAISGEKIGRKAVNRGILSI